MKHHHNNILSARALSTIALLVLTITFMPHATAQTEEEEVEAEDEIVFPESMDADIDSLLNLFHSKTYLNSEDDCQTRDVNPVFSKEVYIDRLFRMPTVMEMPYNEVVQTYIDRYTGRLRRSISFMLGAQNFYMPIFEEALATYQLPLELKYLPIIESALNPKAVSRAGAAGLWQFMLTTGKDYGLEINSLVDERFDPVRSSYAAARYLKDLYNIFGDWNLVIGAYNCGPQNIAKAIHRAGGERTPDGKFIGTTDYWDIYPFLPRETRGYVPAFIAANYVMTYYCEHNICPMRCQLPVKTDTIVVDTIVNLRQIAEVLNIDIDMLRELNPCYRRDIVPGNTRPSPIRMLPADALRYIDMQDSIVNYNATQLLPKRSIVEVPVASASRQGNSKARVITVRKGDSLGAIAKRYDTSVSKLRKLNNIKGNSIRAGQRLKVR